MGAASLSGAAVRVIVYIFLDKVPKQFPYYGGNYGGRSEGHGGRGGYLYKLWLRGHEHQSWSSLRHTTLALSLNPRSFFFLLVQHSFPPRIKCLSAPLDISASHDESREESLFLWQHLASFQLTVSTSAAATVVVVVVAAAEGDVEAGGPWRPECPGKA